MINHESIVSDCTGCNFIRRSFHRRDGEIICARHPYPRMKWLGGFPCEDASYRDEKPDEEYLFDGKYDSRYRVNKTSNKNKI